MPKTIGFDVAIIYSNIRDILACGYSMNGVCKILLCVLTKQFLLSSKRLHTFKGEGFGCLILNVDEPVKSRQTNSFVIFR